MLDFSGLDQSVLPTDHYALVVLDSRDRRRRQPARRRVQRPVPLGQRRRRAATSSRTWAPRPSPRRRSSPSASTRLRHRDQAATRTRTTARPLFSGQVRRVPGRRGRPDGGGPVQRRPRRHLRPGPGAGRPRLHRHRRRPDHDRRHRPVLVPAPRSTCPSGFQTGADRRRRRLRGAAAAGPLHGARQPFRVDVNSPILTTDPSSVQQNARISGLSHDRRSTPSTPSCPTDLGNPLAIPTQFIGPGIDPATASNISNYSLDQPRLRQARAARHGGRHRLLELHHLGRLHLHDQAEPDDRPVHRARSRCRSPRACPPGSTSGRARSRCPGCSRASPTRPATRSIGRAPHGRSQQDFILTFDLQPTPAFITSVQAVTHRPAQPGPAPTHRDSAGRGPSSSCPSPGNAARGRRAADGSSSSTSPTRSTRRKDYTNLVQLIRSANSAASRRRRRLRQRPDVPERASATPASPDTTVTLVNSVLGATFGQPGYKNRLVLTLAAGHHPAGRPLPALHPEPVTQPGTDLRIFDQFGNQLDGEFLGNPSPNGDGTYENLLPHRRDPPERPHRRRRRRAARSRPATPSSPTAT